MTPYFETPDGKVVLYHGDCKDVMREMIDASVDCVITDPPYGIDYQSARRIDSQRKPKISNDDVPFIGFLSDAFRITKSAGALLCFCRWDTEEAIKQAIVGAGFTVRSQVIWDRMVHGMGDLQAQFAPQHDNIWFATKNGYSFPGKRPTSIVREQRIDSEKLVHPNEKPVVLMKKLILAIASPGSVILDPCAGSGSTLVAAYQMGYRAVGIELEERYCEIAAKRLQQPGLGL